MRTRFILISFLVFAFAKAYAQQPTSPDENMVDKEATVKQKPADAVKEFFNYFHKKDTTALREMMINGATLNSLVISESKGKRVINTPISEFLKGIAQIPDSVSFEERLIQLKTTSSADIATVNTTYEFYMNKGFTHNGINVFTLVYIDDKWKVAAIVDTRQYP